MYSIKMSLYCTILIYLYKNGEKIIIWNLSLMTSLILSKISW
jgi:hypothetical protein